MAIPDWDELLDQWKWADCPEIPLWDGIAVGHLPRFLAHCARVGHVDGLAAVRRFLAAL